MAYLKKKWMSGSLTDEGKHVWLRGLSEWVIEEEAWSSIFKKMASFINDNQY